MKKNLLIAVTIISIVSCNNNNNNSTKNTSDSLITYGNCFSFSVGDKCGTLYPHSVKDLGSAQIVEQIHLGLVKFDNIDITTVIPGLADSWEISADRTTFTFHLNKDAHFQDDPCFEGGRGRKITSADVKYSIQLLCTKYPGNSAFNNTLRGKLLGSEDYYNGISTEISGLEVIDDYTVKLISTYPSSTFLYTLANYGVAILPKEGVEKYHDKCTVGVGPFKVVNNDDKELLLIKNNNYFRKDKNGNNLPYLDSVRVYYLENKYIELEEFIKGNLSVLFGIPADNITEMLSDNAFDFEGDPPKYLLSHVPELMTQYYSFNLLNKPFDDVRVRKAINLAINRKIIVNEVLDGQAFMEGHYGLVPPIIKDYDTASVGKFGYSYEPDRARDLLSKAGYANGVGFPTIQLKVNSGGTMNTRVAFEIQKQLMQELKINVDIDVMSLPDKILAAEYGKGDLFRDAWVADYPDPESFLYLFYGKNAVMQPGESSEINTSRFNNPRYDSLFEMGMGASDKAVRYKYFAQAELVLLQECPTLILWYNENFKLLHSNVWNFIDNPMNFIDLSKVFIKPRLTKPKGPDNY